MNRYFLAISAILLSSLSVLLFGGSSVGAASDFDNIVRVTQNLTIKNKDNNLIDLSTQWRNQVVDILTHQCDEEGFQNGCVLLESFQKYVGGTEEGRWGVIANFEPSSEQAYGFTVFWASNADPVCNFAYDNPDYSFLRCSNSTFYQVTVTGQQGWDYYTDSGFGTYRQNGALTSSAISVILTPRNSIYGSNDFFIWYFDVNYPDGYDGVIIPQTWDVPVASGTDPLIDWRLGADLLFSARFIGMYNGYPVQDVGQFRWRIYAADDDYNILGDPLDDSYIGFQEMYKHQFDVQGHYVARFTVENKIPSVVDFDKVTRDLYIQLDVNGLLQVGGTNKCDDGVCKALPVSCKIQQDFLSRLTCSTQQLFSFGVVGPSIIQLKNLMVSMTVNSDPQCYIPLTNVTLAGKVFPLSQYSSVACQKARDFRDNFPFVSIALNFALAILLIHLIVKMINNLTDDKQNDVIVGP